MKRYHNYKDSNIQWIGEVPMEWNIRKLKYLAKIKNGKDQKEVLIEEGGYPILGTGGEFGRASAYLYDKPSVLLGRKGTINKPFYIEEPFWTVDTLFYTEIYENTFPKFLFYLTKTIQFDFYQESSAVPSMTQDNLNNIKLCHPSIEEQTQIAAFLDYKTNLIDTLIEKKKCLIDLLKEKRQTIITESVTKGLNSTAKMKNSGVEWLGNIPEHWKVTRLKYIAEAFGRIGYRGYTTEDIVGKNEGAITLSPSNMKGNYMTFENCTYINWDKYEESPEIKIYNNDILMVKTGSTYGKVGIVKDLDTKATINPQLLVLKNIKINPDYLYNLLRTNYIQYQIETNVIGSTIPTISQTKVLNFSLPLPPNDEIETIMNYIQNQMNIIDTTNKLIETQIQNLQTYRQSLILEAVTGKIDIREWLAPQ